MADTITGTSQNDRISGSIGDEIINALAGFDTIIDYGGNDTLSGGDDADLLIYLTSNVGVNVDLAHNTAQDTGGAGIDILSSIEHITARTGRGNDTIRGTRGTNRIETGLGNDTINPRAGNDLIITGYGTKLIDGGDGFDIYQFQSAKRGGIFEGVTLSLASQGTVQVSGRLTITLSNIEALDGGRGDDVLIGDDKDNVFGGNLGNDEIRGGAGNDNIAGDGYYATDNATFNFTRPDGLKTGGNDRLYGDAGDDRLIGGAGDDLLNGGADNDQLFGGLGANTLIGGAGDDRYFDVTASDTIMEKANGGIDTVAASTDFVLAANVENLILEGKALRGTGNAGANTITGTSAANVLDGGAGADILIGGIGNDTYIVDNRFDSVIETGNGADQVFASVDHVLAANVERLDLTGSAISGTGNLLANILVGTGRNNVLNGDAGPDTMIGGAGNDTYFVDNALDKVDELENGGTDTVRSTTSAYTLRAHVENLTLLIGGVKATGNSLANQLTGNDAANELFGKGGDDTLSGAAGNDRLFGDDGDDVLNGGMGNDVLTGGEGRNIFRFNAALGTDVIDNFDTITDFKPAGDTIQLDNAIFAAYGSAKGAIGASTFKSIETGDATDADDTIVYNSATGALFYDANGNTNGLDDATQIATLAKGLVLTNADFVLI